MHFVYTGCFQVCPASTQFLAKAVAEAERAIGPGSFRVATIGFNLPFDHLLQATIVDQSGRIYRQVYGDAFDPPLFVGPLLELAQNAPVPQGNVRAFLEQVRLLCTVYDPAAGRYRLNYVVLIELIVGTSVMLGGLGFVGFEWRRRRRAGLTQVKPVNRALS